MNNPIKSPILTNTDTSAPVNLWVEVGRRIAAAGDRIALSRVCADHGLVLIWAHIAESCSHFVATMTISRMLDYLAQTVDDIAIRAVIESIIESTNAGGRGPRAVMQSMYDDGVLEMMRSLAGCVGLHVEFSDVLDPLVGRFWVEYGSGEHQGEGYRTYMDDVLKSLLRINSHDQQAVQESPDRDFWDKPILTYEEAAELLGVSVKRLQNIVAAEKRKTGKLPSFVGDAAGCIGRRIFSDELMNWLKKRRRRRGRPPKR